MKNLIGTFLVITLVFSVLVLPSGKIYAQVNTQNTTTLEMQLNTLQKELIVLLNKKVAILQMEWRIVMKQRLKNLQTQLIGLLEKHVFILRSQLADR